MERLPNIRRRSEAGGPTGPGQQRAARRPTPEIGLADLAWTLFQGKWTILVVTAAVVGLVAAYVLLVTPTFESNVVIQVEDKSKSIAGMEELASVFSDKTPAETEIEIIRSRTLISEVVDQLGLDIEAYPRTLPVLGAAVARLHRGAEPAAAPPGLDRYAWGGERIRVSRLNVPDALLDEELVLTALAGGRYTVARDDGQVLVGGQAGKSESGSTNLPALDLFVQELTARPGTRFKVVKRRRADVVDSLLAKLVVYEKVKKTGIIVIGLSGSAPAEIAAIVDAVAARYQRRNVLQHSAEAAKTLEFIESQLPMLKTNLDAAEAALNAFKTKKGTVDLSTEMTKLLERSVDVEKSLSELQLERSELQQRFAGEHPALAAVDRKMAVLRGQSAAMQVRLRALPETEIDSARLVRDAKVANELYFLLNNKAQELRVVKSGSVGNVRIVDPAVVPVRPVSPKRAEDLVVALLLGLGVGVAVVFLRQSFAGASDPDEIEAAAGVPVYVSIPHSAKQSSIVRAARRHPDKRLPVLAVVDPGDAAVENLRVLRTSVKVALAAAKNNVIGVGGPSPGVGKTFVSVNLAELLAAAGDSVLLVDADLRRGIIHRHFGLARGPGVAEALTGEVMASAACLATAVPNLSVLPAGNRPQHPAELLSGGKVQQLLEAVSGRFDLVVVDVPPILAVADSALIARHAGVNLLVLSASKHTLSEIALAVRRLEQGEAQVSGLILNDVRLGRSRYGKGGRYRRYEYRPLEHD